MAAAVYSHHHVDHVFGTARFEQEAGERPWAVPIVYGHADLGANFDRYLATGGWNEAINRRQFALAGAAFSWPDRYHYPDVTYHDRLTFRQGGVTDPASSEAHALRADVYGRRAADQTSSMARNLLNHAAMSSQQGQRDLAGDW